MNLKKKLHFILILIIIISATAFFFHSLFFPQINLFYTPDFGHSDFWNFNYPIKDYLAKTLKKFQLPLWTTQIGNGFPLFAESQIGSLNIFNLVFFFLLPTFYAINFLYISIFLFNSFGCFFLAKELKLNNLSSLFLAIIFPFSGFFIVHIPHLNLIQSASFLPWLFLFNLKLIKKQKIKDFVFFSLFLSQQIFAGHAQITFISLFSLMIFDLAYLIKAKKVLFKTKIKLGSLVLLTIFIGFSLSAIQLLPSWELKKNSFRKKGISYESATQYPYPYKHLITFLNPYILGNPKYGTYKKFDNNWGIFWENTAYLGLIPLFLFFFYLLMKQKNKFKKSFIVLLAVSFLLIFGKNSPLYFIFSFSPFNWFRVPSRYLLSVSFSISILSAFGFEELIKKFKERKIIKIAAGLIIFISFLDLYLNFGHYHPLIKASKALSKPKSISFLDQGAQIKIYNYQDGFGNEWNKVFLKNGWQDIIPYLYFSNSLDANSNLTFNISSFDDFQGLVPRRGNIALQIINQNIIKSNNQLIINNFVQKMFDIYSIKYFLSPIKIKQGSLNLIQTIKPPKKKLPLIYIYQNQNQISPIRLVDNYKVVKNIHSFMKLVQSQKFDPSQTVLLETEIPAIKNNQQKLISSFKILENNNLEKKLKIKTNKNSLLIFNDSFYPGWQASIDEKETKIYPANINQKAINVSKGEHLIKLKFQPESFKIGILISSISLLIGCFCLLLFPNKNLKNL